MSRAGRAAGALWVLLAPACVERPVGDQNLIVVSIASGPSSLDPRFALDDASQKIHQLIFDTLLTLDENLSAVTEGGLAEGFEQTSPTTYLVTLRPGVRFHDGHELAAADVVYTFRSILDPGMGSPRRGAFRGLARVTAEDRYRVHFSLDEPFPSLAVSLAGLPILPEAPPVEFRDRPIGTGPYRFVRHHRDDRVELAAFDAYWQGAPSNSGLVFKVVPDEVMCGLELRKGTIDILVNDVSPDILRQLAKDPRLQTATRPGVDYQYIGVNHRDPILRDVRVRQALAFAIDRQAIVDHLRRGLARPADFLLPPSSWAHEPKVFSFGHDPDRARRLLDEAGYPDPDGEGPGARLRLTLRVSNLEFNRLQSSVIQQDLARVGVGLDVRTYEFATLFADVLAGNFQLYTLQWPGGAVADPDILRMAFHSTQVPPAGFNRGRYVNARVDRLLDAAQTATDPRARLDQLWEAQRILARDVPYISLWHKTNFVVAQANLRGIRLTPTADLHFLKDVRREPPPAG